MDSQKINRHIPELDGLRALAIIFVFLFHYHAYVPVINLPTFIFRAMIEVGGIGVFLFFALSGFLITGILIDTKDATNYFSAFYARRALRIFPLYYATLVVLFVAPTFIHSDFWDVLPVAADRWLYWSYLSNWITLWKGSGRYNYLGHFWSLAVEEQFYIVWALIVWLTPRRAVIWVAGSFAVLGAISRVVWLTHGGHQGIVATATTSNIDTLLAGAVCACLFRDPATMRKLGNWIPSVAFISLGMFFLVYSALVMYPHRVAMLLYGGDPGSHTFSDALQLLEVYGGETVLAIGFSALTLWVASFNGTRSWLQNILRARPLTIIGTYSYGIYVFHFLILGIAVTYLNPKLFRAGPPDALLSFSCLIVLAASSFGVAAISYELFERRILGLKRHFKPSTTPTVQKDIAAREMANV